MSKQIKKRVLSGVQPSGAQVHIGNYLGAMKRFVSLSKEHQTIICVVDLHALTSVDSRENLESYTQSLTAAYLAIGLDPKETIIFRQSDVPEVCELSWYLACQFPLGLLERAHALKDARAKSKNTNAGLMFYPILMAADILLYKATSIPVGADQKQHLEMTRDVAERFNAHYGEIFPLPEPLIEEETGVILGTDGRKMSKSYDNYIGLFEEPKQIEKKIKKIVTDSKAMGEKLDPATCNVFSLYKFFATKDEIESLAARYRAAEVGYGHAKQELSSVMMRELDPMRVKYLELMKTPGYLQEVLADGAGRARAIALETMAEVRVAQGICKL